MDNIIEKLTEIETVAKRTRESVSARKKELAHQSELAKKAFNEQQETETRRMTAEFRRCLEVEKEAELKEMQEKAAWIHDRLETYCRENHDRLVTQIVDKVLAG